MRAATLTRLVTAVTIAVTLVACSDDDDAAPVTSTAEATTPGSTCPSDERTADRDRGVDDEHGAGHDHDDDRAAADGGALGGRSGDGCRTVGVAGELLAPANGRGYLLIGTAQARPGERSTVAMWESAEGEHWTAVTDQPSFAAGTSSTALDGVWHGTELAVAGFVEDEVGAPQPAVWSAPDGATFGEPSDPFGQRGASNALATSAGGLVAAGYVRGTDGLNDPVVAIRATDSWQTTLLPIGEATEGGASGVAASGTTVVVTGWTDVGDVVQAAAWVSADGGVTFAPADTAALQAGLGSDVGTVVVAPSGFVAVVCTANGPTPATALATSVDGLVWQRVDIAAVQPDGQPYPNVVADCTSLLVSGERLLVGSRDLGRGQVLDLGLDGTGGSQWAPRGAGRIAESSPLIAPRPDGTIAAVSRESRGFSSGRVEGELEQPTGSGLPPGRPSTTSFGVNTLGGGFVARAIRYPIVTEQVGSYTWTSEELWTASPDGVSWTPAGPEVVPAAAGFVRSGNGTDIAFGSVDDPADDTEIGGPAGGTGLWVRGAGAGWEDLGLLTFGPGGETIDDAVAVPAGFVAIGSAQVRRADGTGTSTPLALASADGRTWGAEVVPTPSEQTALFQVCALPDGGALASGTAVIEGVRRLFLARRDVAGVWTAVDTASFPTDVTEFSDCALLGDRTVLVTNRNGLPLSFSTMDGADVRVRDRRGARRRRGVDQRAGRRRRSPLRRRRCRRRGGQRRHRPLGHAGRPDVGADPCDRFRGPGQPDRDRCDHRQRRARRVRVRPRRARDVDAARAGVTLSRARSGCAGCACPCSRPW